MKKNSFLFLMSCLLALSNYAQTYSSQGINLVGRWDDTTIAPNSSWVHARYISCYGWADSATGHEYAILGSQLGTHIIDLINPSSPVQVDFVPGRRIDCLWREYKTYSHYLYMVSDDPSPNSFQIADLSYLPDSVHVIYDSDTLFERAHTIFIDGDKLYAGSVSMLSGSHPMAVYSLANPALPQFLRSLRQDYPFIAYVHDMFVKNDTVYASCGGAGLHLFKYTNTNTFVALDSFLTSPSHYNHSSYISDDGHTLFFTEEVPAGQPVVAMDVSDPSNISMVSNFQSNQGATPHNLYVLNNMLYVAYYQDGLQVFDVSDPLNVTLAGYFDTFPFNTTGYLSPDYQGAWGSYPFLPSGMVLVSDMQSGLFILDTDSITAVVNPPKKTPAIVVYPNPARETVTVRLSNFSGIESVKMEILDLTGRVLNFQTVSVAAMNKNISIPVSHLAGGIYLVRVTSGTNQSLGTVRFARQ